MRWIALAVVIAACKAKDAAPTAGSSMPSAGSSAGSSASSEAPSLEVVGCVPAALPPRPSGMVDDVEPASPSPAPRTPSAAPSAPARSSPSAAPSHSHSPSASPAAEDTSLPDHVRDTRLWTPFAASLGLAPKDTANAVAIDLYKAIFERASKLDACFGTHTGSLRAVLRVAFDGAVIGARTGGIGDHRVEACLAGKLIGIEVTRPPTISEVACDFVRGAPAPWRVTLDAGYRVIDAAHLDRAEATTRDSETTFVIVADPSTPSAAIDNAMTLAIEGSATLVAVRVDAGAPVLVGMGLDGRDEQPTGDPIDAVPIVVDASGAAPKACAKGKPIATTTRGKLGTLFDAIELHCKRATCANAIEVAATGTAGELAELAVAARASHVDRLVVSGARCESAR